MKPKNKRIRKIKRQLANQRNQNDSDKQLQQVLDNDQHYQDLKEIIQHQQKDIEVQQRNDEHLPYGKWDNLPIIQNQQSILFIIGSKNTGKSTLCSYLYNSNLLNTCILDVDIGKNMHISGCVSLTDCNQKHIILVGQLTPVSNINGYLNAVQQLYKLYRQRYFTKTLIVNTMGYLSGIGQILMYQVYAIVKPMKVIILEGNQKNKINFNIKKSLQSGSYSTRLYFSNKNVKVSAHIIQYQNANARKKNNVPHFQNILSSNKIESIEDILTMIHSNRLKSLNKINLIEQYKNGNRRIIEDKNDINMRIVFLGKIINEFMFVLGVGYGWQGKVFFDSNLLKQQVTDGIINEGIDFDRNFYHLSEKRIINIQLMIGETIPYLQLVTSGLGSKGNRNLPSRKALLHDQ